MTRGARSFLWFAVCILLSAISVPSFAKQVVAPIDVSYHQVFPPEGCAYPTGFDGYNSLQYLQYNFNLAANANCAGVASYSTGAVTYVPPSYTIICTDSHTHADCSFTIKAQLTPNCPAGTTFNSATGGCDEAEACTADQLESTGTSDIGTSYTSGWYTTTYCNGSCNVVYHNKTSLGFALVAGIKHYYITGSRYYTGTTCSAANLGEASTLPADTCAAGDFLATVNGITKCFSPSGEVKADTQKTETTSNSKTTNPDGSTTITTTTTNNYDGSTSTSSVTYPAGTTVPDVPTSSTKPADDKQTECDKNPDKVGCAKLGDAPADPTLGTKSIVPTSITPVTIGGNGTCPADVPLPHGAAFSWQPACDFASGLKPIILAMAWIAAAGIVLGVKTNA